MNNQYTHTFTQMKDLRMELELSSGVKVRDVTRLHMDKVEQIVSALQSTVKKINA